MLMMEDAVALAAPAGAWLLDGRKPLKDVQLDGQHGLVCTDEARASLGVNELLGVRREGARRLVFVGYRSVRSWWGWGRARLRRHEVVLECASSLSPEESEAQLEQWHGAAKRLFHQDPRPLLVLVNPKSGAQVSVGMWNRTGKRVIADDAGHAVEVIHTERHNHALELVQHCEGLCDKYKGIVIVSGDGLMHEVLQGVMRRPDWERCVRELPLGIIPAGSGNGLARSIADEAGLPHDATSAAFLVARGGTRSLDVNAFDIYEGADVQRIYSFLSLEWALVADIDIGSEYLRSLGELRFTIEGLKRLFLLRRYGGRLSYLPAVQSEVLPRSAKDPTVPEPPLFWDSASASTGSTSPPLSLLPAPGAAVPGDWRVVEGVFWDMWNCNVPWMAGTSKIAPEASFSDGYTQLLFMRENGPERLTRFKLLRYLLGLDDGAHQNMSFVEMSPTRAYRFEPLPNPDGTTRGTLAIDGEVVKYTALQGETMRGFLRVFGQ